MKSTNKNSISASIIRALEENKTEEAKELMTIWESQIKMGTPATWSYFYTKLRVLLKRFEEAKEINARVQYLHDAIETGNTFFVMNELQGFSMDDVVMEMWCRLVDISAEFYATTYLEEGYEGELEDDNDSEEECDDRTPDLLTGALRATIGEIIQPNFKG